jgi:hypothetical protein
VLRRASGRAECAGPAAAAETCWSRPAALSHATPLVLCVQALLESKLVALGHTLETLKRNLVAQASSSIDKSSQAALHSALDENEKLRVELQHLQRSSRPGPGGSAGELQVELAAVRAQVSELQLQHDDTANQLRLERSAVDAGKQQLAKALEDAAAERQRFEREVEALRHVASERQRRLRERDEAYRLSGVGSTAADRGLYNSGRSGYGSSERGEVSTSRARPQPLQDFAESRASTVSFARPSISERGSVVVGGQGGGVRGGTRTPLQDLHNAQQGAPGSVTGCHVVAGTCCVLDTLGTTDVSNVSNIRYRI